MKKYLLLLLALLAVTATAQERSKWAKDMLDAKHKMLVTQMELTQAQQNQFLPLYEAMETEVYNANRQARRIAGEVARKGNNATDADYQRAAEAFSNATVQEGEIEARYFAMFSKILSKKQLFHLKQAENNFTRKMLQKKPNK